MPNVESRALPGATAEDPNSDSKSRNTTSEPRDLNATLCTLAACEQLVAAGDLVTARERLLALERVSPANEREWKRLHTLCLELKDRTRAQVYTERFLLVCNNSAAAHLANAQNFGLVSRNRDRVLESIAEALRNPGVDAGFWKEIAKLQNGVHDHEAACTSARNSILLDRTDIEVREILISSLGVLKLKRETRIECAALAECLVQSRHKDPLRWARLARIAAEVGANRQAKSYIDKTAEYLSDVNYGGEFELIRALLLTGQPKRAMKHLQHFLGDGSQNTWLWTTLLEIAMSRRYYDIASIIVARLKDFPHLDPEFLYRLSLTEKIAIRSRVGILNRFVQKWIWPHIHR